MKAEELASLVRDFRAGCERDAPSATAGSRLSSLVLGPVASAVPPEELLVLVADDVLAPLPFAALPDPGNHRPWVERNPIVLAPSATHFVRSSSLDFSLSRSSRALLVGDPQFDRSLFPAIPALPGARREVRDIAELYEHANVLVGREATPEAFLTGARSASVVHYAGHAVASSDGDSRLLLSPSASGTDVLAPEALGRLNGVRVVVLAACRTAQGPSPKGEGPMSAARGFLAAGVPTVAATLWDIPDDATRQLFVRFHRGLIAGETAADALRAAQLALLHGTDPLMRRPSCWAGVEIIGRPGGKPGQRRRKT